MPGAGGPARPEAYDRRRERTISPDTATVPGDVVQRVYLVESREGPEGVWELRSHTEHRSGRSWSRHIDRINRVVGLWHNGALAFTTPAVAVECASALADVRYRNETEFRVVELVIYQVRSVVGGPFR